MVCDLVTTPDGPTAIVCSRRRRQRCACGRPATLLCDWKRGGGGTCDKPLCTRCTTSPAADKDLCPAHAEALREWDARREAIHSGCTEA